ncbi:MAG TPA: hypothetical protein VEW46_13300 [Pyrinomonadaceae bacterium]|nr:hypothetical protein [Pyrinomonadaceae bacterium]
MRQATDIIGQIYLVVFFFVMAATPLAILILRTINFVRALGRCGTIVLTKHQAKSSRTPNASS